MNRLRTVNGRSEGRERLESVLKRQRRVAGEPIGMTDLMKASRVGDTTIRTYINDQIENGNVERLGSIRFPKYRWIGTTK